MSPERIAEAKRALGNAYAGIGEVIDFDLEPVSQHIAFDVWVRLEGRPEPVKMPGRVAWDLYTVETAMARTSGGAR